MRKHSIAIFIWRSASFILSLSHRQELMALSARTETVVVIGATD